MKIGLPNWTKQLLIIHVLNHNQISFLGRQKAFSEHDQHHPINNVNLPSWTHCEFSNQTTINLNKKGLKVIKQSYSIRVFNFLEKCILVEWTAQLNKGLLPNIQGWLPRSFNGIYLYLEPNSPNHIALLSVSTQYSCPHWPCFLHLPSIMAHLYTCARTGLHCIWANQPSDTCQ